MTTLRSLFLGAALAPALHAAAGGGTARVQVIHNCADLAAATVDVWVDNTLLLDDFAFRTASPFVDAPAGIPFTVGIAPSNSTSSSESIYTQNFVLDAGGTYVVVAEGIVSGSGYSPAPAFTLAAYAMGQEAAGNSANTDILVHHGCTDAPAVDVFESAVLNATAVDNAAYGDFSGYLALPTNDYVIQVRDAANTTIVATYAAPLNTLGLGGAALVVCASGFLDPSQNSGGPAFGLWAALPSGGPLVELPALANPSARVQVIHNSADAAAATVDVWINDALAIDDFAFRTATPFIDLPATIDIVVGIAPPNSDDASDAIAQFTYNLADGGSYVIVADGIVSGSGYNPNPGFDLKVYAQGQEAAGNSANTDVLVHHGCTDAPTVDVFESAVLNATAVDNAAYGDFAGYLALPTNDYVIQVRDAANTTIVATYAAPLNTLGLGGAALVVCASGFLDPSQNSGGPGFGLWAALPSGGPLVELPALANPSARVQVIHNSADLAASTVDVWINDALAIDDFAFRTATPFIDLPATIDIVVGIAPPNSDDASDAIAQFTYNLADGGSYVIVANGIVSGSGYNPVQPFNLYVKDQAREAAQTAGNTDVLVFHGSTDAPVVDVAETAVLNATVINDLPYGDFTDYLSVPADDYVLEVQTSDGTPVVSYQAPLSTLGLADAAITVLASGFLDPSQNSDGPAFGLWVALASGGPLVELPVVTSVADELEGVNGSLYPNPAQDIATLQVTGKLDATAVVRMADATGRVVFERPGTVFTQGTDRIELPVTGLAPGLYNVSIIANNAQRTYPLHVIR